MEEAKQTTEETKPESHYDHIAKEVIALVGDGVSFDQVEKKIADALEDAYRSGAGALAGTDPTHFEMRSTVALERIADHLGAFRKAKVDEKADVGRMRELLAEVRNILRFPRMTATPDMIKAIDEVLR